MIFEKHFRLCLFVYILMKEKIIYDTYNAVENTKYISNNHESTYLFDIYYLIAIFWHLLSLTCLRSAQGSQCNFGELRVEHRISTVPFNVHLLTFSYMKWNMKIINNFNIYLSKQFWKLKKWTIYYVKIMTPVQYIIFIQNFHENTIRKNSASLLVDWEQNSLRFWYSKDFRITFYTNDIN